MNKRWHVPSASATPWDDADFSELTPGQRLAMGWHRRQYLRMHESDREADREFSDSFARESCPRCGSERIVGFGRDKNGLRRWHCSNCRHTFNPVTGTIFENRKLSADSWVEFLLGPVSFESLAGIIGRDLRSPTTPPYQLQKVFLVPDGTRDGVVLSGRVQVDEMYHGVPASEAEMGKHGKKPGFSQNQTCVAITAEEEGESGAGRSCLLVLGRGKPSGERAMKAYGAHIKPGSTLVHDKESAHDVVAGKLALKDEAYDSRVIKRLPDEENPLWKANRLCFLLRLFLDGHSGFDRSNFDGWLDLFSVMVNPPEDRLEKVAIVLDRAMASPVTLRYRDYCEQIPSSEH